MAAGEPNILDDVRSNGQTAPPLAGNSFEDLSKTLDIVFMVAPVPFFLMGIPCAPGFAKTLFRTTCVGCAGFMSLGFSTQSAEARRMMHVIGLLWNIIAFCVVTAWWCGGVASWSAMMVMELVFVALSSNIFFLTCTWRLLAITALGAGGSYVGKCRGWVDLLEITMARRLSAVDEEASPPKNGTAAEKIGLLDPFDVWGITMVLLALFLVAVMLFLTVSLLHARRGRAHAVNEAALSGAAAAPARSRGAGGGRDDFTALAPPFEMPGAVPRADAAPGAENA